MQAHILKSKFPTLTLGILALGFCLVSGQPAAAQDTPLKIGVVDLELIAVQSPAGQELQGKLEQFRTTAQAEVETLAAQAQDIQQRAADGANSLSPDRLAELQREYEDKGIALRRLQEEKQQEAQRLQQQGLKDIETQLEPIFKGIRDDEGYDLILNNVPGVVVLAGERANITQKVLDRLNAAGSSG